MTVILALIGLASALVPILLWWLTNRAPNRVEKKLDAIDTEVKKELREIDEWLNQKIK